MIYLCKKKKQFAKKKLMYVQASVRLAARNDKSASRIRIQVTFAEIHLGKVQIHNFFPNHLQIKTRGQNGFSSRSRQPVSEFKTAYSPGECILYSHQKNRRFSQLLYDDNSHRGDR